MSYVIKKFSSSESAIEFMNKNYIPHELIISLTPTKYFNIGGSGYGVVKAKEWTLIFNQTSSLPFFH